MKRTTNFQTFLVRETRTGKPYTVQARDAVHAQDKTLDILRRSNKAARMGIDGAGVTVLGTVGPNQKGVEPIEQVFADGMVRM